MARAALMMLLMLACVGVSAHAQSRFLVDSSNIRLETAPPKNTTTESGRSDRKGDSNKGVFKGFRAGACHAQASPLVPSSSWPARGEAAMTVCRP